MRPWSAAPVALFVLLSGCSGTAPEGAPESSMEGVDGPKDGAADLALAPLVLDGSVPLSGQFGLDGTFPTTDTCSANPDPGCTEQTHDLGAQLTPGLPMKVTVDITWTAGVIFHMEARVNGEGMTWLRVDNMTIEAGHAQWGALLIPGPSSEVVVISGGPQDPARPSDSPYHVEVNYTASNNTVPALVPVAVGLGPNATLRVESLDGEPVQALLYGPDDLYLQEVEGDLTLPADAKPGDYIVMPRELARFLVPGGGELRIVGVAFTSSDEVAIPQGSAATISVSSPTPPFLAGVYFVSQQQTPIMFGATYGFTLTDPDGVEVVVGSWCTPFCLGGFSSSWSTGFGKPLKAGSYTLTAESQVAHDSYAGAFLASFDRSVA
jgi:hypothetical protein